ncbi:MAG: P-loop NTPase, partial [Actinomycetota bacterium]
MATEAPPTVLVAADDPPLLDEIVRFLDRIPSWRLVTCTGPAETALNAIESNYPDATVLSEGLALEISAGGRPVPQGTLVVVGRGGDPDVLKAAIRLGARGFVEWPDEMQSLQPIVERTWSGAPAGRTRAGQLYGVWSPKGGSGASTVAAHLAAAIAGQDRACILLDLDAGHADQEVILGMDQHPRNFADLLRMGAEISPAVVDEVAVAHPAGFRAVLASPDSATGGAKPADVASAVNVVRHAADFVVADLPSTACETTLAVLD